MLTYSMGVREVALGVKIDNAITGIITLKYSQFIKREMYKYEGEYCYC